MRENFASEKKKGEENERERERERDRERERWKNEGKGRLGNSMTVESRGPDARKEGSKERRIPGRKEQKGEQRKERRNFPVSSRWHCRPRTPPSLFVRIVVRGEGLFPNANNPKTASFHFLLV